MTQVFYLKCDVCDKYIDKDQVENHDYIGIKKYWGYFSDKDQMYIELVICCHCFNKIDTYISYLGGKVRKFRYDMLSGDLIGGWDEEVEKVKKQNDLRKASTIQGPNKDRQKKRRLSNVSSNKKDGAKRKT